MLSSEEHEGDLYEICFWLFKFLQLKATEQKRCKNLLRLRFASEGKIHHFLRMAQSVQIKVCGMTCEEDVEWALTAGADYFGFIVYSGSPRGLTLKRAIELAAHVPPGRRVIVDVETATDDLHRYLDSGFDYFQIHAALPIELATLTAWSETVGRDKLWLAPRIPRDAIFPESILSFADTILLDTYSKDQVGGTGHTGDWGQFRALTQRYSLTNWVLAGGLSPENVTAAIAATQAHRIDVNSGVECRPGKKDPKKLHELFQVLRPESFTRFVD
jgi:phosphoribosylanthranilate isomerase